MRKCISIIVAILGVVGVLSLTSCSNKENTYENDPVVKIVYENDIYELRISNVKGKLDYYKNNKLITEAICDDSGDNMLKLPSSDIANDFSGVPIIANGTYKVNLSESASYMTYLENEGYVVYFQANTPKFIECYMAKTDTGEAKRLVIASDYMVTFDVEPSDSMDININDYIFN